MLHAEMSAAQFKWRWTMGRLDFKEIDELAKDKKVEINPNVTQHGKWNSQGQMFVRCADGRLRDLFARENKRSRRLLKMVKKRLVVNRV